MQHSDKEQNELVQLCKGTHRGNTSELNDINDFELTYNPLMSNDELERIRVSVGNYVSMNSFFSTTLDRTYALFLISSAGAASSTTLQPILFEIDPLKEGMKPFADISAESHFNTEREVLFMLGSIFKIENVILTTTTDGNSYWSIKLSLASENDYELREKNYEEALVYFIRALEIEETCLPSDHYEIAKACENIRFIRFNLGDYETALPFFEKGFNIKRKSLPAQHHSDKEQNELVQLCKGTHRGNTSELNDINDFELTYNPLMSNDELERIRVSVGNYVSMNSFFSTTLDRTYALFLISSAGAASSTTLQPILFEIDPLKEGMKPFADISAESHFNTEREVLFMLGSIFKIENVILTTTTDGNSYWSIKLSLASENDYELREKNYEEALVYFIRALEIEETCLPSDHYEIAKACENIRFIRFNLGDYETALPFFEKGFNIKRKSLPAQHVDLGMTYHNFGLIYEQTEKLKEASENFLMAKQIYRLY
ncbi:unnamed protein product [Didymodactylos carnosus]|uniref:Tetratricopeptide repeat protein n=1 Tax=Didymodactylos carnosus TaxID=1234261 RepID=A0A815UDU1_9BILA|nr:unnamed protein product [Didymodactylos carnosus]CAF4373052.1 unnamed protein product [Didymodactylos carnosus]